MSALYLLEKDTDETTMVAAGTHSGTFDNMPVLKKIQPVAEHSVADIVQAELDARINILDKTSMVTITDIHGTIIYANDLFCKVSGYPRGYVIGQTHSIIRHPQLPQTTVESIWEKIRGGESWMGTMKSRHRDGSDFWTKMSIEPVMENEKPVRFVWVRHDITDLKHTEANLYEAKQRADQQLLDNVRDAYRIQRSLLPNEKHLEDRFPNSFVMFSPKQAVSGDFYWFRSVDDETVVVLGDGTGHGVSAAFVSLIALTGLKYTVDDMRVTDPGLVLSHLNDFMFRMMSKNEGSELRESVDISFCRFNHLTREFSYACGRSRIFLIRDQQVQVLSQNNESIGAVADTDCLVKSEHLTLQPGDRIFMMSDGMVDQFGGERNKRLGSRHVRELFTLTSRLPMHEQKEIIRQNFLHWKGSNEQTDDLSLIGFQVD